jgi:hypothetical protein
MPSGLVFLERRLLAAGIIYSLQPKVGYVQATSISGNVWYVPAKQCEFCKRKMSWRPEYRTCYKLDIAQPEKKIGIEVDGSGHQNPLARERDTKKEMALTQLGWRVLRFLNQEIMNWNDAGRPMDSYISTTLRQLGIHLSR